MELEDRASYVILDWVGVDGDRGVSGWVHRLNPVKVPG
jgi:hypothetical protein